jgi:tetratricopeptide (TPR) repeat protein
MDPSRLQLIILADPPEALRELFGISMLERLLRVGQRLGFREAIIISRSLDEIKTHLAKPSWARAELALSFRPQEAWPLEMDTIGNSTERVVFVSAGFYYDARLLAALAERTTTTLLVDSAPPEACMALWKDRSGSSAAALVEREWLSRQEHAAALMDQLSSDAAAGRIETLDAAQQPSYVRGLRKEVRPVFFPAPTPDLVEAAERFPRDAAQPDVQAFVERLNAPLENWIVRRLCRTSVTPNQVTLMAVLIGLVVTGLFATGHLWAGVLLAYIFEVLDGVDGKLARVKVETTAAGKWEHVTDYFLEMSWWSALAFQFHARGMGNAWWLLLLLVGSDLIDRLAKRPVKKKLGRHLDDVSNFDRFVRFISSRRCINIFILAAGLLLGDPENAFGLICGWMAATAAVHIVRASQIRFGKTVGLVGVLIAMFFLSAAGVATYFISNAWKSRRHVEEGFVAAQQGDCETAISKFDVALSGWLPRIQRSYAHANRGYCYSYQIPREESLRDYDEAIRLNPKFAWAFEARGLFYEHKGDSEKALHDFSRAIKLDPNSAEALFRRGRIFLARQQADEAIADLREAIRARPGWFHNYFSLGEAYSLKKDWVAAIASFDSAIRIDPHHPATYRKRAAVHETQGELRKAERDTARAQILEKRLQGMLEPATASELHREASSAAKTGNHDIAIELYSQLLGTKLSREVASTVYMDRGTAHLARGEIEKGLHDYALALESNPKNAGVYVNRSIVALRRKEYDSVIADCSQALQLNPAMEEAYINRARAYKELEKLAESVADSEKAIALNGKYPEVSLNQLAWIRATSREKAFRHGKEAIKAAIRACELTNWENPGLIDTLAAAYAENGEFEKAVEMQAWAVSFDKLDPEVRREMEGRLEQFKKREPYRE